MVVILRFSDTSELESFERQFEFKLMLPII